MSARFARQISMSEIGTVGQRRIEQTRLRPGRGDLRALAACTDYLSRAGVRVGEAGRAVDVLDTTSVEAIAGRPELVEAAAFLAGALAATEQLVTALGLDRPEVRAPSLWESEP